ncbi:unnamed protein product [Absidia cylindrospora]
MMTFEDIVDMDWLDSHSVKGEPMDLFPNDFVDFNHYLSTDLLSPKLEHASSPPPLLMASSPPSAFMNTPATSCSAAAALAAATTTPPPPLTFPTTEQIKQLIELAKHQLALRASQTNASNNNINNTNSAFCSTSNQDVSKSQTASSSSSSSEDAAVSSSNSPASPSTSHLAAHLANTNLFGSSSNLPDTVSPEYLMKPPTATDQQQPAISSSVTSKSTLIKTEQDGINSSPSSLDSNVLTPMDTMEESSTASATKVKKTSPSSLSSLPSNNSATARRDSLLGDDIGSLEAYAESDGIDIKKLTPKERRQLRNKISARNFRVRRKEYITTLEQQVNDHKKHAEGLAERLGMVENENKQLRQEVDTLKRQNLLLQQQQVLQPQAC